MEYLQMGVSFEAVKRFIQKNHRLHYLLEDNTEIMAVPLHGGYFKNGVFIDRFAKDESMYENAKKEGYLFLTRNLISCLQHGELVKQFVVIGTGSDVVEILENGMEENNY